MTSKAKYQEYHGEPFLVQASPGLLENVEDPETPETLYAKQEEILKSELARVMSALPAKEAEALTLWVHGLTQSEIARRDGVTQAAVSIRAKRGIEKLFAMRDSGQLSSLEMVWNGFHKLKKHIEHEIDIERATDSDTSLPLGEELGDELGTPVKLSDLRAYPAMNGAPVERARLDVDRTAKPKTILTGEVSTGSEGTKYPGPGVNHIDLTTGKRTKLKCEDVTKQKPLNANERLVMATVKAASRQLHLDDIAATAELTYLQVRNAMRKLVKRSLVRKLGKGMYEA